MVPSTQAVEREDSPSFVQPKNGGLPWGREGFVSFLPENQSCWMGETFLGLLQKRWSGLFFIRLVL